MKLAALLQRLGLGRLRCVTAAQEGVVNGVFFVSTDGATDTDVDADATSDTASGLQKFVLRLSSAHMFGKPVSVCICGSVTILSFVRDAPAPLV